MHAIMVRLGSAGWPPFSAIGAKQQQAETAHNKDGCSTSHSIYCTLSVVNWPKTGTYHHPIQLDKMNVNRDEHPLSGVSQ